MSSKASISEMNARLASLCVVPVVKLDCPDDAEALGKALLEGGIEAAEITFRAAGAAKVIETLRKAYPDMVVGAGTVVTLEQCKEALAAGAQFIVSPGYSQEIVDHCLENGVAVYPGCITPSDMMRAVNSGLEVIKFFPAEQSGGLSFLKAVAPVFGSLKFMPTGGVNAKNLQTYLAWDRIVACGGSWMVAGDILKAKDFAKVTALSKEAMELARSAR